MISKNLLLILLCCIIITACQTKIPINNYIASYQACPDTLITYESGADWSGLGALYSGTYEWGTNGATTTGTGTYYQQKPIGKGSVLLLDGTKWVIERLEYKRLPTRKGNPKPSAAMLDIKLYLRKVCT